MDVIFWGVAGSVLAVIAIVMQLAKKSSDASFANWQREQSFDRERQIREFASLFPSGIESEIVRSLQPAIEASKNGNIGLESQETLAVVEHYQELFSKYPSVDAKQKYEVNNFIISLQNGRDLCEGTESIFRIETWYGDSDWLDLRTDRVVVDFKSYPLSSGTQAEVFADGNKQVNYTTAAGAGSNLLDALSNPEVFQHVDDDRRYTLKISDPGWSISVTSEMEDDDRLFLPYVPEAERGPDDLDLFRTFAARLNAHIKTNFESKSSKSVQQRRDVADKLIELSSMLDRGLITESEFKKLKAKSLSESE